MQRTVPLFVVLVMLSSGCLEQPGVGKAAAPSEARSVGPVMGSTTTNDDLKKKLDILEGLLDGKLDAAAAAKTIDQQFGSLSKEEQDKRVASLREALAEAGSIGKGKGMPRGPARDMIIARLYFSERRFIEAAMLLSRVLDQEPRFPTARNLLARCFYFLGNPDRTVQELDFILNDAEQGKELGERLDALFLLGAAVAEQPGMSRRNLERGLWAWEAYLKEAPESPQRKQVEEGLEDIRAALRGEGPLAESQIVKREAAVHSGQNVMGGEASFDEGEAAGGAGGAPQERPAPTRVRDLPEGASPFERALATGLDALDVGDLALAEQELKSANQLSPSRPEVLVGLGRIFVQSGRVDEALRTFGEAIKLHPGHMPAWHYNGMAHMMSGDGRQAIESWEHIMKVDPEYAKRFSLDRRIEVARGMTRGR